MIITSDLFSHLLTHLINTRTIWSKKHVILNALVEIGTLAKDSLLKLGR